MERAFRRWWRPAGFILTKFFVAANAAASGAHGDVDDVPWMSMFTRRFALATLLATALGCLLAGPGAALGAGSDTAATEAYLRANLKLVQVARSHLAASENAPLTEVLAKVRRECPAAGAKSPQNPESTHMSYEVIGAIVTAAYKLDIPAALTYARTVTALHWSSSAVTKEVREHAAKLKVVAGLAPPNLCADVRAWAADGYHSLPASTVQFDARFEPAWVAIGVVPSGLRRFENPPAKALARRNEAVEEQLFDGEARVTETSYEPIMDALDLWP